MKVPALCLATLAVTAQADKYNWAGKWYAENALATGCYPAGLLTVTQEGDKATIKGKWDPFNAVCKEYEMAGQAIDINDGVVGDANLIANLKSKNGTEMQIIFNNANDKQTLSAGTTNPLKLEGFETSKKSDDDVKKFKKVIGTYSFKITEGDDKICCIPQKMEVDEQETAILYTTGKWANSEACKNQKVGDAEFNKVSANVPKENTILFSAGNGMMGVAGAGPTDEKKPDELFFTKMGNDAKCKVTVSISGSKWWIWLIVAIVVALVVAGAGFFFYKKRQASNKHTPLMTA